MTKSIKQAELRELPIYTPVEAAFYLRTATSTLRNWLTPHGGVIKPAQNAPARLSFLNLAEAFVLSSIRKEHGVTMQNVRKTLQYVERELGVKRPLVREEFKTDGVDLFVERFGKIVNVSQQGQTIIRDAFGQYLERIDWDAEGLARRLFPWVTKQSRAITIDPSLGYGRPVLSGTGIRAEVVVERFMAGESFEALAADYGLDKELIQEAIRSQPRAAA